MALLAGAIPLLGACRAQAQPLVRIGLVVPLSGSDAPVGENILAAARYAIAEANEESAGQGPRFVLAAEDEATLPDSLVPQARKLAADPQNIGVVGYLSQGAVAAPVFAAADLPFLVLGSGPLPVPGNGGPHLRLAPSQLAFVETTTRLVTERLAARRVAIAWPAGSPDSGDILSRVAESLRAAGLVVEPPVAGPAALPLAPPPDVVLVAGPGVAAAEVLLEIRSRGYAGPLVCVDGCDTPDFLKVARDHAAGTVYLAAAPAPKDREVGARRPDTESNPTPRASTGSTALPPDGEAADPAQRLSRASTEAWPLAALAYDGVRLLAAAARRSGTAPTRQAVTRALLSSPTPVPGATGPLIWDQAGQRQGLWPAVYEYAELRYPARLIRWPAGSPGT